MGKPYDPSMDSYCQYLIGKLLQRVESDVVYYTPEHCKKKKPPKYASVLKLLNDSKCLLNENIECSDNADFLHHQIELRLSNKISRGNHETSGFSNISQDVPINRVDFERGKVDGKFSESFRNTVYKRLAVRLDNEIKLSSKTKTISADSKPNLKSCVYLLKTANCSIDPDVTPVESLTKSKKMKRKIWEKGNQKEMLLEAAVDADWVLSKTGTLGWTEVKRPKVLNVKVVKTLSDGAVHCEQVLQCDK